MRAKLVVPSDVQLVAETPLVLANQTASIPFVNPRKTSVPAAEAEVEFSKANAAANTHGWQLRQANQLTDLFISLQLLHCQVNHEMEHAFDLSHINDFNSVNLNF
jgi:hypothetical protein